MCASEASYILLPLKGEFQTLIAKPEILTPANASQSMILRRNAYGLQMQMGSLYEAQTGKFTSVVFPVCDLGFMGYLTLGVASKHKNIHYKINFKFFSDFTKRNII